MAENTLALGEFGFQWHITWRCGAKCKHCYQSDWGNIADPELDGLKGIADRIMEAVRGPVTINITGGEPLLYRYKESDPDSYGRGVFQLMAYLGGFDKLGELNLITSSKGLDRRLVEGLKSLPKLSYVKVSLESEDGPINDAIRGRGHHRMVIDNIGELVGAGLRVIIMTTLGKHNYRSVEGLCSLAAKLGTAGVMFERFVPLGRGAEEMAASVLEAEQWREVLSAIGRVADVSADDLLPFKAFWVADGEVMAAPCCLGRESMALMPDGTVFPCRRVPTPVGKLPEDGMERILDILEGYSATPQKCFEFGF
ncbi:MAG: radical SAM protein [Treponema sp.]|nr:radical SAM protein [Treponema sp.]